MSDATKELRIRYILDKSQAEQASKEFHRGEKERIKGTSESAMDLGKAMLGIVGIQTGMALVGQVVSAIGSSMKEAADYTKRVAESFGVTRDMMREIASIQGKGLSNEFVASQLDIARQAQILTPQEFTQGMLAFQQYGSGYIGEEGKPGSRITQAQLNELLPNVMAVAKVQGVEQDAAMTMFAKVVQSLPAHSKTEDYKNTYAKMMEMAKQSAGSASLTAKNLAPFMAANVGEGMTFEATEQGVLDATKVISTISEMNAPEAGAYAQGAVTLMERLEGKQGEAFGFKEGSSFMEKLDVLRALYLKETGGKMTFTKWLRAKTGEQGDIRGVKGLQTLIQKGIGENFFGTMDEAAKGASGAGLDKTVAEHLATAGGSADARKAREGLAEAERGRIWDPVQAMIDTAATEMKEQGKFEEGGLGGWLQSVLPGGGGDRMKVMATERAMVEAQRRASEAGVNAYVGPDAIMGQLSAPVSELGMRQEIKRLIELTEQANAQRSRQVPSVPPPIGGRPTAPAQMPR